MEQGKNQIELYKNDIQMYFDIYCEDNNILDMRQEPQSVFTSCLHYIQTQVFKDRNILRSKELYPSNNLEYCNTNNYYLYNYDLLIEIMNIYIFDLAMKYNKTISIMDYSVLTGIPKEVVYNWANDINNNSSLDRTLSQKRFYIYKSLHDLREETLSNKLIDGKTNVVGVIAILNHSYKWSSQQIVDETRAKALTVSELPKLERNYTKPINEIDKQQDIVVD